MRNFKVKVLVFTLLVISTQSSADDMAFMPVEKYLQLKRTAPEVIDTYLSGVLTAYTLTNAMLERNKQKKLYCSESLVSSKGLQNYIDHMVGKNLGIKGEAKIDVAVLALLALTDTFPCMR